MTEFGGVVGFLHGRLGPIGYRLLASAVVVGLAIAGGWLFRYVEPRLKERFDPETVEVGHAATFFVVASIAAVLLVVIWGATEDVLSALGVLHAGPEIGVRAMVTVLLVTAAYMLTRILKRTIRRVAEAVFHDGITDHQRQIAFHLVQVSVYVLAGLVVLSLWGIEVGNLLLGAGFLGIVLGLAARQTLGAVIAGFVLLFARPFEVGDWVQIGDREGVVTEITIVNTRLRTFDDEYVMIPNDSVTGSDVINRSRQGRLRITVEVGVDYETDIERAVTVAEESMRDVDDLLRVPSPRVVLKRFGDSSVVVELRCWIDRPSARRMWQTRTAVIEEVKAAFEREGIKIPFPQRELTGRAEAGGLRLAGEEPQRAPRGEGIEEGEPTPTADGGGPPDGGDGGRGGEDSE